MGSSRAICMSMEKAENSPVHPSHHREELRELVRMRKRGVYIYALPNLLTAMNFLLGYLSIISSIEMRYERAAWTILLATIFDMLDGRVARFTKTTSKFGLEFDSLCDLISFGLAPAVFIYLLALRPFGRIGLVVSMLFGLFGAMRLARFNVMAEVLPKSYFQGLPIPMASITLCTAFLFAKELNLPVEGSPFFLALTCALALLMVSTFKFPSFKDIHFRHRRPLPTLAAFLTVLIVLISWFEIASFVLFFGYIVASLSLDILRNRKKFL